MKTTKLAETTLSHQKTSQGDPDPAALKLITF